MRKTSGRNSPTRPVVTRTATRRAGERSWPSAYDSARHGKWGCEVNFHNVGGDAGPSGSGGVGWGFGRGISALCLEWKPELPSPSVSVYTQPDAVNMRLPVPRRDVWHTYVVHWIAGRTDGTTVRPGAITVWADGANKPVVDRHGINTVQRARGPDGAEYTQRWLQLWEGDYTSALPVRATTRLVLTRIGRTLRQAVRDRPRLAATNLDGWRHDGTGADHGPPLAHPLGPRPARLARIPATLLGRRR